MLQPIAECLDNLIWLLLLWLRQKRTEAPSKKSFHRSDRSFLDSCCACPDERPACLSPFVLFNPRIELE